MSFSDSSSNYHSCDCTSEYYSSAEEMADVMGPDTIETHDGRNLYMIGVADRQAYYDKWLTVDPIYKGLVCRHLNHGIFLGNWDDQYVITCACIATVGRFVNLKGESVRPNPEAIYPVVMAELLGPCLDVTLFLDQNGARGAFTNAIYSLITSTRLETITEASIDTFAESRRANLQGAEADTAATNARNIWNADGAARTFENAYAICLHIAHLTKRAWKLSGLTLLIHTYVSILKRGTVTTRFLTKIQTGVEADLGFAFEFRVDAIKAFFDFFGYGITNTTIPKIIAHWKSLLPAHALRLVLTVDQAALGGLTSIVSIGRAIKMYSGFKWSVIARLFPEEVLAILEAVTAIGDDKYYGFKKNLEAVRSTRYKSVAYVAIQLLIQVGGEASLRMYAGMARMVPNQAVIDVLIAEYIRERSNWMLRVQDAEEPEDEECDQIENIRTAVIAAPQVYL